MTVHRMLYPVPPLASIRGSGANCRAEGRRGGPRRVFFTAPAPPPPAPHPLPPPSPPLALESVFEPQVHQQSITGPLPSSAALCVGGSRHSGWRWNVDQIKTTWTSSGCVSACVLLFALMHLFVCLFVCWSARLLAFTCRAKSQPACLPEYRSLALSSCSKGYRFQGVFHPPPPPYPLFSPLPPASVSPRQCSRTQNRSGSETTYTQVSKSSNHTEEEWGFFLFFF